MADKKWPAPKILADETGRPFVPIKEIIIMIIPHSQIPVQLVLELVQERDELYLENCQLREEHDQMQEELERLRDRVKFLETWRAQKALDEEHKSVLTANKAISSTTKIVYGLIRDEIHTKAVNMVGPVRIDYGEIASKAGVSSQTVGKIVDEIASYNRLWKYTETIDEVINTNGRPRRKVRKHIWLTLTGSTDLSTLGPTDGSSMRQGGYKIRCMKCGSDNVKHVRHTKCMNCGCEHITTPLTDYENEMLDQAHDAMRENIELPSLPAHEMENAVKPELIDDSSAMDELSKICTPEFDENPQQYGQASAQNGQNMQDYANFYQLDPYKYTEGTTLSHQRYPAGVPCTRCHKTNYRYAPIRGGWICADCP